jgi:hypothetical protein
MNETSLLAPWMAFYTVTGSAAAALTGLMFVVITLVRREDRREGLDDGIGAFSTPTVVHLGTALLVSAVLVAPWPQIAPPALIIVAIGAVGGAYMISLMIRITRFEAYIADSEDWVWYNILPFLGYGALVAGGAWAASADRRHYTSPPAPCSHSFLSPFATRGTSSPT